MKSLQLVVANNFSSHTIKHAILRKVFVFDYRLFRLAIRICVEIFHIVKVTFRILLRRYLRKKLRMKVRGKKVDYDTKVLFLLMARTARWLGGESKSARQLYFVGLLVSCPRTLKKLSKVALRSSNFSESAHVCVFVLL